MECGISTEDLVDRFTYSGAPDYGSCDILFDFTGSNFYKDVFNPWGDSNAFKVKSESCDIQVYQKLFFGYAVGLCFDEHTYFLIGKSSSTMKISVRIAVIFTVILEGVQLTSFVSGTFDVWDIMVEIIGELFAVWMNKKTKGGFL